MAALNQSPSEAAAAPFVRVLAEMFGSRQSDASLALPVTPLDEMYAVPAQRYIESRGGEVRVHARARYISSRIGLSDSRFETRRSKPTP